MYSDASRIDENTKTAHDSVEAALRDALKLFGENIDGLLTARDQRAFHDLLVDLARWMSGAARLDEIALTTMNGGRLRLMNGGLLLMRR